MALTEEEKKAKARLDRQAKINQVWRDYDELKNLQNELDSIAVKYDVNLSQAENDKKFKKPIEDKIKKAKAKLNTGVSGIKKSGDKELVKEFDQFAKEDKDFAKAINYKTSKPMAKKKSSSKWTESGLIDHKGEPYMIAENATKQDLQKIKAELKRIELTEPEGKKSAKWKAMNRAMYERVVIPTLRKNYANKMEEAQYAFDNAETEADIIAAKQNLDKYTEAHDLFSVDRWKGGYGKQRETVNTVANYDQFMKKWQESSKQIPKDEVIDVGGETYSPEDFSPQQTSIAGTPGTGRTTTSTSMNVDDIGLFDPQTGQARSVDDVNFDGTQDWESELASIRQQQQDYANLTAEDDFQFEYAPDSQSQFDVFGNLIDAGRGILGAMAASEDLPEYKRGDAYSLAMDDATRMRDMGLSEDELAFRERQQEEAYGYDVKNIKRLAGGSGAVALANLGRAQSQLYKAKGETAAVDEATRRLNRQNFQQMALQDERINRQIFEDDLRATERNKEAGGALLADAMRNIQERIDFNKQYGKGSQHYEYMKELTHGMAQSRHDRMKAGERQIFNAQSALNAREAELENRINRAKGIDGTKSSTAESLKVEANEKAKEQRKNLFKPNIIINEKGELQKVSPDPIKTATTVDTSTVGSNLSDEGRQQNIKISEQGATKRARADELEKLMMETDDMELLDKYSKEMESLNL